MPYGDTLTPEEQAAFEAKLDEAVEETRKSLAAETPPVEAPATEPEEPTEPEETPTEPTEPETPAGDAKEPEFFEYKGRKIATADLEGLLSFGDFVTSDPARMQAVERALAELAQQGATPPPKTSPVEATSVPEVDEEYEALPQKVKDKLAQIDVISSQVEEFKKADYQRRYAIAEQEVARAKTTFAEQKNLKPEDVEEIATDLGNKGWLPMFIADAKNSVYAGTLEALDVVYNKEPKYRGRDVQLAEAARLAEERKKNAGKVGGSSASTSRIGTPPKQEPLSLQGHIDAVAADFAKELGR